MALPINIEDLLSGAIVEGTRMEFKEGWNPAPIMRSVCAFANDFENEGSGYIIVGVEEKDGKPIRPVKGFNPDHLEKVEKELIGFSNLIKPSYYPRLSLETIDGKHVLVLWVPAGSNRPYKVPDDVSAKHKTYNYRIRYRSNSIVPNEEQERELIELTAKIPFDDRVNSQAKVSDLSFALMRDHLEKTKSKLYEDSLRMSIEELAQQMNLSQGTKEHLFPKNVGLLMFTEHPERYFKGVQIDVVEYPEGLAGKNFTEKTFTGQIQKQLTDVLSYIQTNIIKTKVTKFRNKEQAESIVNYPYDAIEEALSNAVYHRNYELQDPIEVRVLPEAIEIISYSGVDSSLKQADFDKGVVRARRYRNRRIGEFLKELRLTEGRGTGIPTIQRALEENGSDEAKFDTDEPDRKYFLVEIPIHKSFRDFRNQFAELGKSLINFKKGFESYTKTLEEVFAHEEQPITFDVIEKYIEIAKTLSHEQKLVLHFVTTPKKRKEILEDCLDLTNQSKNFTTHVEPLIEMGLIERTLKDKPTSQLQRYVITDKGNAVKHVLDERDFYHT
ncbi:RNA-binding domain-containing protein [Flavobacterium sp. C4GT6]|uniref:RNA-binding domain-containing protein n=1 Tax=Flavobacterium sp. C4GT6 TaxID=3103818 RepID=UPI002ED045A2